MRDGWRSMVLSDVVELGRSRVDPRLMDPAASVIHYSIPAFDNSGLPVEQPAREIQSHKFVVDQDAVLVSLLNPRIPRTWRVQGSSRSICSTELAVLVPADTSLIDIDFLFLW